MNAADSPKRGWWFWWLLVVGLNYGRLAQAAPPLEWVEISGDQKGFVLKSSHQKFTPWGFNYDHDERGRLIEDYWLTEWRKVEEDFGEMKRFGANVVRVHLQFGQFMETAGKPNRKALRQLGQLLKLAEQTGLYLDLTGLACYHKQDVPAWYEALPEADRWTAQAHFWQAIAKECRNSPAVFCYDLMNEPLAPVGPGKGKDWLPGQPLGGEYFVQMISLEANGREREEIARTWVKTLVTAIHQVDKRHLVTVGLVDWSLKKPNVLYSGFAPEIIAPELDFVCVHLYPVKDKLDQNLGTLKGFSVGKPVVIEETFPLSCSVEEFETFIQRSKPDAAGWIGFYWGKTPEESKGSKEFVDILMTAWLEFFQKQAKAMTK